MPPEAPEHFVDTATAADFLQIRPRHLLELARKGELPAYPLGSGARRTWRFRLADLSAAMERKRAAALVAGSPSTIYGSPSATTAAKSK